MNDEIHIGELVRTERTGIQKIDRIDTNKTINRYLYFGGIDKERR